jgi:hypothetical protein
MIEEKPQIWFRVANPRTLERMENFTYE